MKLTHAAALLAFSVPALSQTSGVSNPPPETDSAQVTAQQGTTDASLPPGYQPTPARRELTPKPNAGTPVTASETYTPYQPAATPVPAPPTTALLGTAVPTGHQDPDGMIVSDSPTASSQSPNGNFLRVRVHETLSTETNHAGDPFTATVTDPFYQDNHVLIPPGSTLEGRLTEVRGGRRIHGAAALHLEPRRILLPDGTHYDLHAQLIDSSESFATRIDSEGTLYRRDHIKQTVAALGIATGTGAVAGAVFGGGVGAGVGALVGAGVGTAWWLKQDRQTVLPRDTNLVFTLNDPITTPR